MKRVQYTLEVVVKVPDRWENQRVADDLEAYVSYPDPDLHILGPTTIEHVEVSNIQEWEEEDAKHTR